MKQGQKDEHPPRQILHGNVASFHKHALMSAAAA